MFSAERLSKKQGSHVVTGDYRKTQCELWHRGETSGMIHGTDPVTRKQDSPEGLLDVRFLVDTDVVPTDYEVILISNGSTARSRLAKQPLHIRS